MLTTLNLERSCSVVNLDDKAINVDTSDSHWFEIQGVNLENLDITKNTLSKHFDMLPIAVRAANAYCLSITDDSPDSHWFEIQGINIFLRKLGHNNNDVI